MPAPTPSLAASKQPAGQEATRQPIPATPAPVAPNTPVPSVTPAPAATNTAAAPPAASAAPSSAAPTVAYATQLSVAHAVVLVYPKGQAPVANLPGALIAYDNKFFRVANLQVQLAQDLGTDQEMIVVQALPNSKVAQSYATKLRGPQSPLARLRGQGYQTLVISLANLALLQQSGGNVTGYQQFYQQVYQ
ncbi:MAG: hypothetical protein EOO63_17850 [Hymenobacter sp.]|nr:MAG: hypothetical protein EOO63_17850 [Hymenobacter sp.]